MSSVNFIFIIFAFILASCTSENKIQLPSKESIHQSEIGYFGPSERTINLTFIKDEKNKTITAEISLPYALSTDLSYNWKPGAGVQILSGPDKGQVSYKEAQSKIHLTITVENFFTEPERFVRFEIFGKNGTRTIFADGLVASENQKSFEYMINEANKYHEK